MLTTLLIYFHVMKFVNKTYNFIYRHNMCKLFLSTNSKCILVIVMLFRMMKKLHDSNISKFLQVLLENLKYGVHSAPIIFVDRQRRLQQSRTL